MTDEDEFVVVVPPIFLCIHARLQIRSYKVKAKKKILASEEICKKCLEKTTEIVRMEEECKKIDEALLFDVPDRSTKLRADMSRYPFFVIISVYIFGLLV